MKFHRIKLKFLFEATSGSFSFSNGFHFQERHFPAFNAEDWFQQGQVPEAIAEAIARETNPGVYFAYDFNDFLERKLEIGEMIAVMRRLDQEDLSDIVQHFLGRQVPDGYGMFAFDDVRRFK